MSVSVSVLGAVGVETPVAEGRKPFCRSRPGAPAKSGGPFCEKIPNGMRHVRNERLLWKRAGDGEMNERRLESVRTKRWPWRDCARFAFDEVNCSGWLMSHSKGVTGLRDCFINVHIHSCASINTESSLRQIYDQNARL